VAGKISPVRNAIRALPKGASFLVAVSGGVDSIVLLHALVQERGFIRAKNIVVAHVDHGLRKSSSKDASFVRAFSKKLGLSATVKKLRPAKNKKSAGGTELWGRTERYKFFQAEQRKKRLTYIVTAHHANDEAETFLMRLLADKDPRQGVMASDAERKIIRPLILVTRKEILSYAKDEGIVWVEDPTNEGNDFLRNKIRNQVIPFIEKTLGHDVVESLSHRAELQKADWAILSELIASHLSILDPYVPLSREWLRALKSVLSVKNAHLRSRIIEQAFTPIVHFALGIEKALALDRFIHGSGKYLDLGRGLKIEKSASELLVSINKKE
jgi:tRNA(Ile)-lysidine synthase